jgi:hypothetical protein
MKHGIFETEQLRRLNALKKQLDQSESKLRTLRGKHLNQSQKRSATPAARPTIPEELLPLLAQDLLPPSRKALLALEDHLRQQALLYFQKSKVDPKLWTDLASS